MQKSIKAVSKVTIALVSAIFCITGNAFASSTTTAPWDSPITTFVGLFQGKIALGIFFGIAAVATWKIIMGGELEEWVRKLLIGVIAVASLMGVVTLYNTILGSSGALI